MRDCIPIMDKKNVLAVGYISPGWPLNNFPNGIVAYIENMLYGLDDRVNPIILTQKLADSELRNGLIDLSSLTATRGLLEKILDSEKSYSHYHKNN